MSSIENRLESSPPWLQELSVDNIISVCIPLINQAAAATGTVIPAEVTIELHSSTEPISPSMESGYIKIESIYFERASVGGPKPALKASIESLPRIQVLDPDQECPICLFEYEVNSDVNQMPCRHMFHSDCLREWLGIHGSCPVCRFSIPVEEEKKEDEMDSTGLKVHVTYSVWHKSGDVESDSGNDSGNSQSQAQYMEDID